MNQKKYISKQSIQLIFGVVLGGLVLLQSLHVTAGYIEVHDETGQKDKDSESAPETTISYSQAITNTSLQLNLEFESYLLNVVSFKEEENEKKTSTKFLAPSARKAIRILLRKIISPNAP